jgi:hypothetical protein
MPGASAARTGVTASAAGPRAEHPVSPAAVTDRAGRKQPDGQSGFIELRIHAWPSGPEPKLVVVLVSMAIGVVQVASESAVPTAATGSVRGCSPVTVRSKPVGIFRSSL